MQNSCVQIFWLKQRRCVQVLNPIMTHSPRMAALTTNKRFGEDVERDPLMIHRMELKKKPVTVEPINQAPGAEALREQTA